jgi:hypothetical protein
MFSAVLLAGYELKRCDGAATVSVIACLYNGFTVSDVSPNDTKPVALIAPVTARPVLPIVAHVTALEPLIVSGVAPVSGACRKNPVPALEYKVFAEFA